MDLTSYIVARMDIYRSQDLTSIIYHGPDLNSYMFGDWYKYLVSHLTDPDARIWDLPSLSVCRTLTQEFGVYLHWAFVGPWHKNSMVYLYWAFVGPWHKNSVFTFTEHCRTLTQEFGVYLHRTLSDPDTRIRCPGTLKCAPLRHLEHLLYVGHPLEGCPFGIPYQCSLRPALFPVPFIL